MSFVPKLYFSPGTVSMVTHMAFEEVGIPYQLEPILTSEGQQRSERYLGIHPLGRVPAVEVAPDVILTETPALLGYLAQLRPELKLLPHEPLLRARADEWMSLLASAVHVSFVTFYRPDRYTSNEAARAALKIDGKERFFGMLHYVNGRIPDDGHAVGDRYTLVDTYLCVFYLWGRRIDLPVDQLARYSRLVAKVLQRPAVRRALEQEGLGQLYETALEDR